MTTSVRSPYAALAADTIVGMALFSGPVFASVLAMSLLVLCCAYEFPAWLFNHALVCVATAGCLGAVTGAALSSRQRLPRIRSGQDPISPWWGVLAGVVRFVCSFATDSFRIPALLLGVWLLVWDLDLVGSYWGSSSYRVDVRNWLLVLAPASAIALGYLVRACTTPPRWLRVLVWGMAGAGLEYVIIFGALHHFSYPESWEAFQVYAYIWVAWAVSCAALVRDRARPPLHQTTRTENLAGSALAGAAVGTAVGFGLACAVVYSLHFPEAARTDFGFTRSFYGYVFTWAVLGTGTGAVAGAALGELPSALARLRRIACQLVSAHPGRRS